jgi:FkbM family methyltransferase
MDLLKARIRSLLSRKVRPHRILGGPLRGYRIVTSWHDYPGAIVGRTERQLLSWFKENVKGGQTWLDVGAHYGYTALALAKLVGGTGRVFAFEPVLSSVGCLGRTRQINGLGQVRIVPFGLSDSELLVPRSMGIVRGMADSGLPAAEWSETIYTKSFDALWPSLCEGSLRIDGVKIDVQGMELFVIRGMQETLLRFRPLLVIEFHEGVVRAEVQALLEACGYGRSGLSIEEVGRPMTTEFLDNKSYVFAPRN